MNATTLSRLALAASLLVAALAIAFAAWQYANNPMDERRADLEDRLRRLRFVTTELPEPDLSPRKEVRDAIVQKAALWKGLIDAPAPAIESPDLAEKLKDIIATRQQAVRGDSVKIKIKFGEGDTRGQWIGVGDAVRGLAVKEIRPDAVVFSLQQNNKEYTAELRRK